ncbi:hypothetical protein JKF63_04469 [Porcisia hertigi]|uniref:Calcineurin-like phosphoesterase domain-containing protein n=1 Tax=Porcisia hertigi TaxID=2761500 RepID=A0A836IGL2_9TRYP|nr:hypothetical protein JKF63_04469 [Porcisia hertigi]
MKDSLFRIGLVYGVLIALFFLSLFLCPAYCEEQLVEIHRIIAVGDVHGDVANFLKILRIANLVEDSLTEASDVLAHPPRWKYSPNGPNGSTMRTTLVQVGDLVDRGEEDLQVLNVAIALQEQTARSGSRDKVVLLIGNHELLNLQGNYHYVNKKNYGGFMSKALRAEGMRATGAFGKYIVDNFKTAHIDEGVVFVHAGIEARMNIKDVETLNADVREALRQSAFRHSHLRSSGPLWTRKMILESMSEECADVRAALSRLNATRVVVGHTPQGSGRVEQYCDGQVLAIDVGMSRWMYDKVAALELVFSKYTNSITGTSSVTFAVRELREGPSGDGYTGSKEINGFDSIGSGHLTKENDMYSDL